MAVIANDGGSNLTTFTFEYGANADLSSSATGGDAIGDDLLRLYFENSGGHTFYGAASATNTIGTAYSDTISWSTVVDVTASLTSVHGSSAVVTASFAYDEAAPTEVGFSWSESADLSNATDSTVTVANDNATCAFRWKAKRSITS